MTRRLDPNPRCCSRALAHGGIGVVLAISGACGATAGANRDYVWQTSELNLAPESFPFDGPSRAKHAARMDQDDQPNAARAPSRSPVAAPKHVRPPPTQLAERITEPPQGPSNGAIVGRPQPPAAPATAPPPQNSEDVRALQRIEAAQALLGTTGLQDRAFIAQVLRAAGQDIAVDAKQPYAGALWAKMDDVRVGKNSTRAGDLVFFRDTADLNGNGKPDDGVTLVGIVEKSHGSHVLFIAHRAGKVRRMAVDPQRPLVIRDGAGDVINTRLVRWPGSAEPWTTGQCLSGYARPK